MDNKPRTTRTGWESLPPEPLPRPTYFPSAMALGTTLIFWGLIASWIISAVGISLFAFALVGWIKEIRHERNQR